MELAKHIEILLQSHNCVIVPDFGGFIANYRSAVIDRANKRILPPAKNILFNAKLTNNDGLLANAVVQAMRCTYPEALNQISTDVADWNAQLAKGLRIDLGELGFLYQQDNRIVFEQGRDLNLLLQAYGLSNVQFVAVKEKKEIASAIQEPVSERVANHKPVLEGPVKEKETVVIELAGRAAAVPIEKNEESQTPVSEIEQSRRRGRWKYIAAAAAIPFLFYSYWIPVETDFIETGKIQMADFNPIKTTPDRSYQSRLETTFESFEKPEVETWETLTSEISEHVEVYNYALADDFYIPIRLEKEEPSVGPVNEQAISENAELPYHVIGGCFSVSSNADQLVVDLQKQGYQAHVLDQKNGLHRVSSGDYATRSEARKALKAFKDAGFSGWLLKK